MGGGEILRTCQVRPWEPPSLLYNGYRVFTGAKERSRRDADPSPHLVLWSRKCRVIPLLPLWAVRPVQSLSTCTRVHFTFTLQTLIKSVSLTVKPVHDSKAQQPQKSSCITLKCIQHTSQYRHLTESAYKGQ